MTIFLKILSVLGLSSAGTGIGLGMGSNGFDWYEIAGAIIGLAMAWLVGSKFGDNYRKMKAVISAVDDALDDNTITVYEIESIIDAFKR